jgi:plasmid stability protein
MAMLQVRNLSPATHQALKVRAAQSSQSLSDYVATQLDALVAVPSWEEFKRRRAGRPVVDLGVTAAELIRTDREQRS